MPNGEVELIGIDLMLWYTRGAMAWNQTPFEEAGWDFDSNDGGIGCESILVPNREMDFIFVPSIDDSKCLSFLYGFMLTRGVPASGGYPALSTSIVGEFIQVEGEIDYQRPWLTESGEEPRFPRTSLRFGISSPEQFALVEPALKQLEADLSPIQNLSVTPNRERGDLQSAFEDPEHPVTWALPTGEPVIRFVAADSMQGDLQDTLLLGLVFCITALWWGFREDSPASGRLRDVTGKPRQVVPRIALNVMLMSVISYFLAGADYAIIFAVLAVFLSILWGTRPLILATITTAPIFLMIVWLYAIVVGIAGYGLNMVTVSIAAIVSSRWAWDRLRDPRHRAIQGFFCPLPQEMEKGESTMKSIEAVGGASGIPPFFRVRRLGHHRIRDNQPI